MNNLDAEIINWIALAKGGDLPGHEFHGNQHTGGIGGSGEPARQRDPGRNQVSADRYKSPNGEEPQPAAQNSGGGSGGQEQVVINPESNTPEALKSFSETVLKDVSDGKQPVIRSEDFPKMLLAMEGIDKAAQDGVDLTELRIDGTNLMGDEGMGVKRDDMPQVQDGTSLEQTPTAKGYSPEFVKDGVWDARAQFMKELTGQGVKVEPTTVDPTTLKPWQCEVNAAKIGGMFRSWRESGVPDDKRILVSSDGYVIDGHHTWVAGVAIKFENPDTSLPIYRLGMTGAEAIAASLKWGDDHGIPRAGLKKSILKWLKKMRDLEALTTIP